MTVECHGLDTPERICFYEQDYYVLSNFSSFAVDSANNFPTSEHYYQYLKFNVSSDFPETDIIAKAKYELAGQIQQLIVDAKSAHAAYQIAQQFKEYRRPDWDKIKLDEMRYVLRQKVDQHEYVKRKLLDTGDRELVENSWRDDYWGTGPNGNGQNWLGKLWMELRTELREEIEAQEEAAAHGDISNELTTKA